MPLRISAAEAAKLGLNSTPSSRKYRNVPTTVDSLTFDSKLEARRWHELLQLQRSKAISDLRRQVPYVLAPSVKFEGSGRAQPPLRLVVDFQYLENGRLVLEDTKSKASVTAAFTIKRHLLLSVHGLNIRLIK